jgi:hypothetical protein
MQFRPTVYRNNTAVWVINNRKDKVKGNKLKVSICVREGERERKINYTIIIQYIYRQYRQ